MLNNHYFALSKQLLLLLTMSIFLIACDKASEESIVVEVETPVPTLTDNNIKDFTIKMAEDYNAKLDSLVVAFTQAQNNGEVYQFVNFRNHQWTPLYIKQKDYYQKVLRENSTYLSKSPSRALFDKYENLIYIGIGLKNGLLNQDDVELQTQLAEIEKDKTLVNSFLK